MSIEEQVENVFNNMDKKETMAELFSNPAYVKSFICDVQKLIEFNNSLRAEFEGFLEIVAVVIKLMRLGQPDQALDVFDNWSKDKIKELD